MTIPRPLRMCPLCFADVEDMEHAAARLKRWMPRAAWEIRVQAMLQAMQRMRDTAKDSGNTMPGECASALHRDACACVSSLAERSFQASRWLLRVLQAAMLPGT